MAVLNLSGNKLSKTAKLSDYLPSKPVYVRLTDLQPGQTVEIDVTLDGAYLQPDKPEQPAWMAPDGSRSGVHTALLAVLKGNGFRLAFTNKSELRQSRGRGLSISESKEFIVDDAWVAGARTAGIAIQDCQGFTFQRPVTVDTSNYQIEKVDMEKWNVAGSITAKGCANYTIVDAISCDHVGNGITATESKAGLWQRPTTVGVYGANLYINASPSHSIYGGVVLGSKTHRPNGLVVNSEEENKRIASEGAVFSQCLAFDVSFPVSVWGNEGQTVELKRLAVIGGRFVGDATAPKLHRRSPIAELDQSDTIYRATTAIDKTGLAAVRNLRDHFADLVRSHASWEEIIKEREALRFAIGTLGEPIAPDEPEEPVEPTPPAFDPEAFRAWLKAGQAWLEQGQKLVA